MLTCASAASPLLDNIVTSNNFASTLSHCRRLRGPRSIRFHSRRRIKILTKTCDLAIANGEDMHQIGLGRAPRRLHPPAILDQRHHLVPLCDVLPWLEQLDIFRITERGKELRDLGTPARAASNLTGRRCLRAILSRVGCIGLFGGAYDVTRRFPIPDLQSNEPPAPLTCVTAQLNRDAERVNHHQRQDTRKPHKWQERLVFALPFSAAAERRGSAARRQPDL